MNKVKSPVRRTVVNKPSDDLKNEVISKQVDETFALGRINFQLIGAGIGVLIVGYILLSLEKFIDATEFSIALYIAPFVIVTGYILIIYAILFRPKAKNSVSAGDAHTIAE